MAFVKQEPRILSKQNVELINAGQNGVYGIFNQDQWIYIGKGDIRQRLLDHINGDNPCILRNYPAYWVDEVCDDPIMSQREKELIIECNPICNRKIG